MQAGMARANLPQLHVMQASVPGEAVAGHGDELLRSAGAPGDASDAYRYMAASAP